jgi:hypothetical protein
MNKLFPLANYLRRWARIVELVHQWRWLASRAAGGVLRNRQRMQEIEQEIGWNIVEVWPQ